jgi:hypothetical protein
VASTVAGAGGVAGEAAMATDAPPADGVRAALAGPARRSRSSGHRGLARHRSGDRDQPAARPGWRRVVGDRPGRRRLPRRRGDPAPEAHRGPRLARARAPGLDNRHPGPARRRDGAVRRLAVRALRHHRVRHRLARGDQRAYRRAKPARHGRRRGGLAVGEPALPAVGVPRRAAARRAGDPGGPHRGRDRAARDRLRRALRGSGRGVRPVLLRGAAGPGRRDGDPVDLPPPARRAGAARRGVPAGPPAGPQRP